MNGRPVLVPVFVPRSTDELVGALRGYLRWVVLNGGPYEGHQALTLLIDRVDGAAVRVAVEIDASATPSAAAAPGC
ncbi:hypothetical protein OG689_19055 [Kitasatospora sp. NBC_00240]|uniref:hypothetical protein n=1 Tax=Kitasatospora sp. NBC_00240 TaxID=2903567 RepID=UPI00224D55BE|nr:hypothetical protein [Kitasatospora sp. NBC_00240]MCX5211365.1 hypothetical protein [Kitasatospora sp. NBC_00240]